VKYRILVGTVAPALATYLLVGLVFPQWFRTPGFLFGFNQLKHLGPTWTVVLCLLGVVTVLLYHRKRRVAQDWIDRVGSTLVSNRLALVGTAALSAIVFFVLRSNFLNPDSVDLMWKLPLDVPLKGAHVTHDEMWELYLHSRFWYYTNRLAGWSVTLSYQVLSSVAGGVFVVLLLLYGRLVVPTRGLALAGLVATGGFMQLFFGDPENYTLTAVLILAYFYATALYLRGRCSLLWPSCLLALAMTFHLLAGWLLPSLAYLYYLEVRVRNYRVVTAATTAFLSIVVFTLLFFHFQGLPLRDLYWNSHVFGHGGDILSMLAAPRPMYYLGLINLLFLLVPLVWFVLPLALLRRIEPSPQNIHLVLASAFMLLFMFSWKATLGVYSDWNLFANAAIPLSLLVGVNLLRVESPHRGTILLAAAWTFALHSYCWIVSNHFVS